MSFNPLTLVPGCLAIIAFIAFCTNDEDCKEMFRDFKKSGTRAVEDANNGTPSTLTQIKRELQDVKDDANDIYRRWGGGKSQRRNKSKKRNTRRNKSKKINKKTKRNKSKKRSRKR